MKLIIGSTVWVFDHNHRVYRKDANGRSVGGPIYREHWVPTEITGETARSWITRYGKFPKKDQECSLIPQGGYSPLTVAFTEAAVDDNVWQRDHAVRIADLVRNADAHTLRKIAELIEYKESGT